MIDTIRNILRFLLAGLLFFLGVFLFVSGGMIIFNLQESWGIFGNGITIFALWIAGVFAWGFCLEVVDV